MRSIKTVNEIWRESCSLLCWRDFGRRIWVGYVNRLQSGHDLFLDGFPIRLNDWETKRCRPYDSCHEFLVYPILLLGSPSIRLDSCVYAVGTDRATDESSRNSQPVLYGSSTAEQIANT